MSVSSLLTLLPKRPPHWRKGGALFKPEALFGGAPAQNLFLENAHTPPSCHLLWDPGEFYVIRDLEVVTRHHEMNQRIGAHGASFRETHPT